MGFVDTHSKKSTRFSLALSKFYAHIDYIIVVVIKEVIPNMSLKLLETIWVVIIHTYKELKHDNGMMIRYDDNITIIIDQKETQKELKFFIHSPGNWDS